MGLFTSFEHYFWLIALGFGAVNYIAAVLKVRSLPATDPRTTPEAKSLRFWFAVISAIPWIVMGVGMVFGDVPNFWSYFRPQDRDPFVLAWYATVFLLAVANLYWVFFQGGAEKTIEFRLISLESTRGGITLSPKRVKLFAALGPAWFALWVLMVVLMDVPVSR